MFIYRNLSAARGDGPQWQYGAKAKAPLKGSDGKPRRFAEILARNVTFQESAASHARCLRQLSEGKGKGWDVHAYACGDVVSAVAEGKVLRPSGKVTPITYDKYGCGHFVRKDTGAVISYCEHVVFAADGHSYAIGDVR